MMGLVEQVANALKQAAEVTGFDSQRHTLVVGVSGGPDSLTLLHVLTRLVPIENVVVAHLDHGLRPGSASEAANVGAMARGVRYYSERVDVTQLSKDRRHTVEEAGRMARYDFLARVARQEGARHIAVGHHADDQVETVLMHLLRGSGPAGLRGMETAGAVPGQPDLTLLRPLLQVSRPDIEQYCAEHGLNPILDESNSDVAFFRNRLRNELLPALEAYNPQVRQRIREMAVVIGGEDDLLARLTDETWQQVLIDKGQEIVHLRREEWAVQPLALRRRLLRRAIAEVSPGVPDSGFRALEAARLSAEKGVTGTQVSLPGGLVLRVSYDRLVIAAAAADLAAGFPQTLMVEPLKLPVPGVVGLANGWQLEAEPVEFVDQHQIQIMSDRWTVFISRDLGDKLLVRSRRKGEKMQPLGLNGKTKLKEIMIDRKIPAYLRERWPVVAVPGHVVWLPGHVLDSRAQVAAGGGRAVRLRCLAGAGQVDAPAR